MHHWCTAELARERPLSTGIHERDRDKEELYSSGLSEHSEPGHRISDSCLCFGEALGSDVKFWESRMTGVLFPDRVDVLRMLIVTLFVDSHTNLFTMICFTRGAPGGRA